ncbi:hypothetical protein ACFPJ1_43035 [Kribbella qitaiheensis]|uniref:hypothetical protein n=1 Tax=Kribbella qitaiheensis TaxID=1544730 RepID=UPI003619B003
MADGLTTTSLDTTPGSAILHVPVQSETACKLIRVPGQEIAVLLTGRAAFGQGDQKRQASTVCAEFLAAEFGPISGVAAADVSVELVAMVVREQFGQVCAEERGADVTALDAGYSPGNSNAESWRLSALSSDPPALDVWFATDFSSFEPEVHTSAIQLIKDELINGLGSRFQERTSEAMVGCLCRILPGSLRPGSTNSRRPVVAGNFSAYPPSVRTGECGESTRTPGYSPNADGRGSSRGVLLSQVAKRSADFSSRKGC